MAPLTLKLQSPRHAVGPGSVRLHCLERLGRGDDDQEEQVVFSILNPVGYEATENVNFTAEAEV